MKTVKHPPATTTAAYFVWLAAGTPLGNPYPCRCAGRCAKACICRGRTDIDNTEPRCCSRRTVKEATR